MTSSSELVEVPPLPLGYTEHHIVVLEGIHVPLLPFSIPHKLTVHLHTEPEQIAARIADATIVVSNVANVRPSDMDHAPNLRLLAVMATGMSWVDKPYCANRGISVVNCPGCNIAAVAEHFLTLYFASRKRVIQVHQNVTTTSEWRENATIAKTVWPDGPPLGCGQETLGIIGYGSLGKQVEMLTKAIGFGNVIVSERKGVSGDKVRGGRVEFEEMLKTATCIVVLCPREPDTIDLINEREFKVMRKDCLLVNIARGGIVNEAALATALRERVIFGAATDVLDSEPGGPGTSPLLPDLTIPGQQAVPNLIVTPHVAWFSGQTIKNLQTLFRNMVEAWVEGRLYEDRIKPGVAVHDGKIWK